MVNKRKPVYGSQKSNVINIIPIENLVVVVPGSASCFMKRLKYKGCPKLKRGTYSGHRVFKNDTILIDANRDSLVRELHSMLSNNINGGTYTNFKNMTHFLSWVDRETLHLIDGDYFHHSIIETYAEHWRLNISTGKVSPSSWLNVRSTLKWYLDNAGRGQEADRLPNLKHENFTPKHHKPYCIESELKPLAKRLMSSHKFFCKHLNDNSLPDIHPLFDQVEFDQVGVAESWSDRQKNKHLRRFKHHVSTNIINASTQVAMMLAYLFTGMNSTPLKRMRICDVVFSQLQGDRFILRSTKDRAKGIEIDNAMGFSKHAKEFIEGWVKISLLMADGNKDAPLFPYRRSDGCFVSYADVGVAPQTLLNELLPTIGLPKINASRLRKTKLDAIMRTTESVYLVSQSGNNSINVVSRNYTNGVESDHEKNLGASMDAAFEIAKGTDVKQAVSQAKFKHADILEHYEYERLRDGKDRDHESRTPLGVRCQNNQKGTAALIEKSLQRTGVKTNSHEVVCTDFLSCFDCAEHALVADVNDIWLMLSFFDTLQQMQQIPAINSIPEKKYETLRATIDDILVKFREKSPANYAKAEDKHKSAPHPLYSNVHSLNDLQEALL